MFLIVINFRHVSKFHRALILLIIIFHFLMVCIYFGLSARSKIDFDESCYWTDYYASVMNNKQLYKWMGMLAIYSWSSTLVLIFSWLLLTRLDIRVFPSHYSKSLNVGIAIIVMILPIILASSTAVYMDQYVVLLTPLPIWKNTSSIDWYLLSSFWSKYFNFCLQII